MVRQALRFACALALAFATPAFGHHSHAMYESTQQVTLAGTVKELQWNNPHVVLYLVVRGENGQANNWALEGGSPAQLIEQGWPSGNPKPGDEISVTIRPLKGGARGGLIRTVTFADRSEFVYGGGPESGLRNNRPPQ
jgi:hypothetical protein